MKYMAIRRVLIFTFWLTGSLLIAQEKAGAQNRILPVQHTNDFTITGDGSAAEWQKVSWNVITQRTGETLHKEGWRLTLQQINTKDLQYQTSFKILYSDKGIYCLYKCEDSVITATLKEDYANLFNEDVVEAFFRPDTTMPVYFEYELSPLNYELPILIVNNKGNTTGWKPWRYERGNKTIHAIKINEKNPGDSVFTWTAEFFIPYRLLPSVNTFPPQKGTKWGANFYRIDYDRNPVFSSWQLTRANFHDFERFGLIEFN